MDRRRQLRGKDCTRQSIDRPISKCPLSGSIQSSVGLALHCEEASSVDDGWGEGGNKGHAEPEPTLSTVNRKGRGYARGPGAWELGSLGAGSPLAMGPEAEAEAGSRWRRRKGQQVEKHL